MKNKQASIYLVEDEALIAMELRDRLTSLDYSVCGHATRGEKALVEIPDRTPDLILMDVQLAGELTGIQTAVKLRKKLPAPVVFLSAFSDSETIEGALGAEPFGYLVKPFEERELHATIQAALYRHRMESERSHAEKLEIQFGMAGGMAHNFNNQLQSVLLNLELLQMTTPKGKSEVIEMIGLALQSAQQAAEISHKLDVFTGNTPLKFKPMDIGALARKQFTEWRELAGFEVVVRLNCDEDLPAISADEKQLKECLNQLITNADEACAAREDGEIRIAIDLTKVNETDLAPSVVKGARPGTYVRIEVSDNGQGMTNEDQAKAFDPFFSTKFVGRGLGLPFVRGVIRSHRGAILLDSQPKQGTQVCLLLPVLQKPVNTTSNRVPQDETGKASSTRTILVVDDNNAVRVICQRVLQEHGFRALAADCGTEAMELCAKFDGTIDCVLMDLEMPGWDGPQTYEKLRRIQPGIRGILTSGYSREDVSQREGTNDFGGFLQKPFRMEELLAELERVMSTPPACR